MVHVKSKAQQKVINHMNSMPALKRKISHLRSFNAETCNVDLSNYQLMPLFKIPVLSVVFHASLAFDGSQI